MYKLLLFIAVVLGLGVAAYQPLARFLEERNKPKYRTAEVVQRTVKLVVNSTGEVKPVLSVSIGSFVSGPIDRLHVDFNDRVEKDQLLAEIDPRIYEAAVARDKANLITREAEVIRVESQLQQAVNDENRSIALREESADYISQAEIDQFHFARLALEAQLKLAKAGIEQAQATLNNSIANLEYTEIRSPVDGIVINRLIDPGQTLAAQFQAPELFVIAPEMEERMHIFATVDEADIGLIRTAQASGLNVEFTVDAYPDDLFEGKIEQVRFSSTENQTVVTYPVVVSAPNPDLKLLPGMTASITFTIEIKEDVLCVPNSALRYFPSDKQQVREPDRPLLDGTREDDPSESQNASAEQKIEAIREKAKRHVWIEGSSGLEAIELTTGIYDNRYTEFTSGDLEVGQKIVIGIQPK